MTESDVIAVLLLLDADELEREAAAVVLDDDPVTAATPMKPSEPVVEGVYDPDEDEFVEDCVAEPEGLLLVGLAPVVEVAVAEELPLVVVLLALSDVLLAPSDVLLALSDELDELPSDTTKVVVDVEGKEGRLAKSSVTAAVVAAVVLPSASTDAITDTITSAPVLLASDAAAVPCLRCNRARSSAPITG